jgi:hypothetical protein
MDATYGPSIAHEVIHECLSEFAVSEWDDRQSFLYIFGVHSTFFANPFF